MAVDLYDSITGAPGFLSGEASELAVDLSALGTFAVKVGTRLIGTTAERIAYEYAREGLAWWDTDLDSEFLYTGGEWVESFSLDTGWIVPTMSNGWVDGVAAEAVGYRRKSGFMTFTGRAVLGTVAEAFVLPLGFRPYQIIREYVSHGAGISGSTPVFIDVDGTVTFEVGKQPNLAGIRAFVPVDA